MTSAYTFLENMDRFERDLEKFPELAALHAEMLKLLDQLEAEVQVLINLNRKNIK